MRQNTTIEYILQDGEYVVLIEMIKNAKKENDIHRAMRADIDVPDIGLRKGQIL